MLRSEGQRLLKRWVDATGRGAQRRLARGISRTEPTISQILSGLYGPDMVTAAGIEDFAGIPMRAWTERPKGARRA